MFCNVLLNFLSIRLIPNFLLYFIPIIRYTVNPSKMQHIKFAHMLSIFYTKGVSMSAIDTPFPIITLLYSSYFFSQPNCPADRTLTKSFVPVMDDCPSKSSFFSSSFFIRPFLHFVGYFPSPSPIKTEIL